MSEPIVEELVRVIHQIESHLKTVNVALHENQTRGDKLREKIQQLKSENKSVSTQLNEDMHSITCLREWHWKYIERFENFVYESKAIFLDFNKVKSNSGFFAKGKKKKLLKDARNFVLLGHTYIETLGDVFDGDYLTLIPGEWTRSEALKLMSERLSATSKKRDF